MLATIIGDVVGSRLLADRGAAQRRIDEVLAEGNRRFALAQELAATVGDEFQGVTSSLAQATEVTLWIRLSLLSGSPVIDVRCGVGWGDITVHDAARRPVLQDGPGWWSAREALDALGQPRAAGRRTWCAGAEVAELNAFLLTRDALVDRLGDSGREMLRLALEGHNQREIAELVGVSRSAVSQQFARGVGAVREAQRLISGLG